MEILGKYGTKDLAVVHIARFENNNKKVVEFVESIQPPISRKEKLVFIISTLFGCPVKCPICDANGFYHGKLSESELLKQIDYLIKDNFPTLEITTKKLKVQFARMGEPSFNPAVLSVLKRLPNLYDTSNIMPCISTVAPLRCKSFLDELIEIKNDLYIKGYFQMQFSIHSTDKEQRKNLIPIKTMEMEQISNYIEEYYTIGDRKVTLNFVLIDGIEIDPLYIKKLFNPKTCMIKITPLNPTENVLKNRFQSGLNTHNDFRVMSLVSEFKSYGFDVIVSIGELEENNIGSNCGQYISALDDNQTVKKFYSESKSMF